MKRLVILAVLITLLSGGVFTYLSRNRHYQVHVMWIEYPSLKEITNKADLVAVIRVEGTQQETTNQAELPHTLSKGRVLRVLKGDSSLAQTQITLDQPGSKSVSVSEAPLLKVGSTYLVFLAKNDASPGKQFDGTFGVLGGHQGNHLVDDQTGRIMRYQAPPRLFKELSERNVDEVTDLIKALQ